MQTFKTIFTALQTSTAKEYTELLNNTITHIKNNELDFNAMKSTLVTILLASKQEIPVRIRQFLLALKNKEEIFGNEFYSFLISVLSCKNKKIRKNAISLLENFELCDDDLPTLSEKLFDKDKGVRREAVKLVGRKIDYALNAKTKISSLLKDLVRYDPSAEVRKEAMKQLSEEVNALNCLLSRCEDENLNVRKCFFFEILPKIEIKSLSIEKRKFLLKRAITERDFDAKKAFIDKIKEEYCANEVGILNSDFFGSEFITSLLYVYFPTTPVKFEDLDCFKYTSLLFEYLTFVENEIGRDSLDLIPATDFLVKIYELGCEVINDSSKIPLLKNLFKILRFYELYDFEILKKVQATVYKLLGKNLIPEIIDECLSLPNISCDTKFIGSLIYKNMNDEKVILLCRSVMKLIKPFSDIHVAIMKEILCLDAKKEGAAREDDENLNNVDNQENISNVGNNIQNIIRSDINKQMIYYEIIYYYCVLDCDLYFLNILKENIPLNYHFLTDLYLGGDEVVGMILKEKLYKFFNANFNENVMVAILKVCLKDKTDVFIDKLVKLYYTTQNNQAKQNLAVFFHEFFLLNPNILVESFCRILTFLPSCHKLWIEQALYWLEPAGVQFISELIYRSCVFLFKSNSHQKLIIALLESIENIGDDQLLIKKIIYCCGLITKKGFNVQKLVSKAMMKDDGVPIDLIGAESVRIDCGIV